MKIRVAILDKDENYKSRLLYHFQMKFADKIELYAFSSIETLNNILEATRIDIVLVDEEFVIREEFRNLYNIVYLCKTTGIEAINEKIAICKFQKCEAIYKQLLSICADLESDINMKVKRYSSKLVLFISAQGGSGISTLSAAYALKCAKEGKKVFYLNLEEFGGANLYFSGNGDMSFTDMIVALKSKKSNLALKLESAIKTDKSGVDYLDISKNTYDMYELEDEEISRLLQGLTETREYSEIIVDVSGGFDHRKFLLMREYAEKIVCVNDGSSTGNLKFQRFCELLKVLGDRSEESLVLEKMFLLYNRYSSKTSSQLEKSPIPVIGGIHRYEGISGRELIEQIAVLSSLEKI